MPALRSVLSGRGVREAAVTVVAALFVLQVTSSGQRGLATLFEEAVVAVVVVAAVVRRPVAWTAGTIVWLPLQGFVLAALWSAGLPTGICRGLGFVKEALTAGLLVAIYLHREPDRRSRGSDRAIAGLVLLVALYFVAPTLLPGSFGAQTLFVRISAVRLNLVFFLLFLALRRLRISPRELRTIENAMLWMGFLLALGGVWELVAQSNYDHVMTDVVRFPAYVTQVLHGTFHQNGAAGVLEYNAVGSHSFVRNGSLLADELNLGFTLVAPLLIGVRRLLAEPPRPLVTVNVVLIGIVLVDTLTRSAILAAGIGVLVLLAGAIRRRERGALLVGSSVVALLLVLLPFIGTSSVGERVSGALNGTDTSTTDHQQATTTAFHRSLHTPLGLGLGSNSGSSTQDDGTIGVTTEDAYLQVSLELGWAGLVLFVLAYAFGLRDLAAIVRRGPPHPAGAALAAGLGLAVGGFLLPVWINFAPSVTYWAFAGACCGAAWTRPEDEPDREPAEVAALPPARAHVAHAART